ncbi:hypothetical protein OESDEN_06875 [Oesophagostomum dentatum]|uniref:Uncharacterized protein n=1 Tax=Oesophagostomum dentatum TaxID=61180 RepID=A0A0B1T6P7_OESDE|nr:hypothetical protein OESDEN_06875 [Oesophagostomum dentatum]
MVNLSLCFLHFQQKSHSLLSDICSILSGWKVEPAEPMTSAKRGSMSSPSGEKLWSSIIQQQVPEDQKVAFQNLIQELIERRKTVQSE